jgi:hypothetical protein
MFGLVARQQWLRPAKRRAAIRHELVHGPLRLFRIAEVASFEHFAAVAYHLFDSDWIVLALIRPVEVNTAGVFFLVRQLLQPWAAHHLFARDRIHPYFPVANVTENIRPVVFPPIYFNGGRGKATTSVAYAAFSALITVFHVTIIRDNRIFMSKFQHII